MIIVPLLLLWMGYGEREATGTSLMAIAVIGTLAVVGHTLYGNVDYAKGMLIGLPAIAGVIAGTTRQQRIRPEAVSAGFALLLVASAATLVF